MNFILVGSKATKEHKKQENASQITQLNSPSPKKLNEKERIHFQKTRQPFFQHRNFWSYKIDNQQQTKYVLK